jgi:serine protease
MKKSFILLATLALMATSANAEQVRVVVSQDNAANSFSTSAKSAMEKSSKTLSENTCLKTTDGLREICVPTPNLTESRVMANGAIEKSVKQEYTIITVEADSIRQVVDTLNSTGWYKSVEADVVVSTNTKPAQLAYSPDTLTSFSDESPDDPEYQNQTYMHSDSPVADGRVYSNITLARNNVINKTADVGVAVLDSGFAENDELQFKGGYSFVTSHGEVRDDNYGMNEGQDPIACGMHGYGVSSVMLTSFDDGQTIAGVINNVNSYALRVMNCGVGYLSDSAVALNYIAKEKVHNVPLFTGSVQVANLSLGGQATECPSYMQTAIDNANKAGITVVVAAGNYNIDASGFTPANCNGVLVVGSVSNKGERSGFSDYGKQVSMAAQGESILGFGYNEKEVYWWEGTSFSAPLVSASIALAKRDAPSLSPSTMRWLTANTTSVIPDLTGECETLGCGTGLLDANALVLAAQKAEKGDLSSIRHALSDKSTCDQQWYVDYFGNNGQLCGMYKVSFFDGLTKVGNEYKLIRAAKGESLETGESILTTSLSSVLVQDIDTTSYDYAFKICSDNICSIDTYDFSINEEKIASPTACE